MDLGRDEHESMFQLTQRECANSPIGIKAQAPTCVQELRWVGGETSESLRQKHYYFFTLGTLWEKRDEELPRTME